MMCLGKAFGWIQEVLVSEFLEACRQVEDGDSETVYGCKEEYKVRKPLKTVGSSLFKWWVVESAVFQLHT